MKTGFEVVCSIKELNRQERKITETKSLFRRDTSQEKLFYFVSVPSIFILLPENTMLILEVGAGRAYKKINKM
ncbi:hypothetical protein D3Z36_11085 [Lachnospiraceae bacterium]|nr:hypothetical protein [Lachnospiraceae bacterium]